MSYFASGLTIAFVYYWKLALILLCFGPFIMGASLYDSRVQRGFESSASKAHAYSSAVAGEAIKEIRTVAALNKQAYFESKYEKATERPHRLAMRKAYLSSIAYSLLQGTLLYVGAVGFYVGMNFVQDGDIEFQDIFTCMFSVMITVNEVGKSAVFASTFAKAKTSAVTVFNLLERQSRIDPDLEGIEVSSTAIDGDISFENIAFRYPARPDIPIFEGEFNLQGKAGQTIALVGPSGCGKSTTIGMLQRWYDPLEGTVRLDQYNVKNFYLGNLRTHMALVG